MNTAIKIGDVVRMKTGKVEYLVRKTREGVAFLVSVEKCNTFKCRVNSLVKHREASEDEHRDIVALWRIKALT